MKGVGKACELPRKPGTPWRELRKRIDEELEKAQKKAEQAEKKAVPRPPLSITP